MNHLFFPPASQIKKTMDDYLSTGSPLKTKARDAPCEVERLILYLSLITTRKKKKNKADPENNDAIRREGKSVRENK